MERARTRFTNSIMQTICLHGTSMATRSILIYSRQKKTRVEMKLAIPTLVEFQSYIVISLLTKLYPDLPAPLRWMAVRC